MNIPEKLSYIKQLGNYRTLTNLQHDGCYVIKKGKKLLNLSSNDYLGIAADINFRKEFLLSFDIERSGFSASSSRLQTGNHPEYILLEEKLKSLYKSESAIIFNSGYHANTGILPAITDNKSLILADKLVHASIIDGIRLCSAKNIRYRHNDYQQLERLVQDNFLRYEQIVIVTESIFSMDGDEADLSRLCQIKKQYPNVMLYVDEAHAFGVRGSNGLGCAEEKNCIADIDFLIGTFGKA
ncbi:MAG: aminotransferase class I/II-fold pyridoxal phosphate-dependent enzyme, partial [Bacteroidaceae bacterium]|nr:aminotransferase class I/II-fold pyridoxal phosphate-dependent enzyme [Bacteroidaceae bacterium]